MQVEINTIRQQKNKKPILILISVIAAALILILIDFKNPQIKKASLFSEVNQETELQFLQFLARFQKTYTEKMEYPKRFEIFSKNYQMIKDHNMKQDKIFEMGVNQFTDMSIDQLEFGLKIDKSQYNSLNEQTYEYPQQVDWRETKYLSSVANQGKCGSCWAFATAYALESALAIYNNQIANDFQVSIQYLIDCDRLSNKGCVGGWMYNALHFIKNQGFFYQKDYLYPQYLMRQSMCQAFQSNNLKDASYLSPRIYFNTTVDQLKYLVQYQPIAVAIRVNACFMAYKKGILTNKECNCSTLETDVNPLVNHAVTLVGYGITNDESDCSGYWIIKNQWGSKWGEEGYIRICIEKDEEKLPYGTCNILSYPQFPDIGLIPKQTNVY